MAVLLDTSFLLAVAWSRDANHDLARAAMRDLIGIRVVAAPVLPEIFYMLASRANYASAMNVFKTMRSAAFQIVELTAADMSRMQDIMAQYKDNQYDFVDVAIMALSERLNVQEIYTLDRRDFGSFRPRHCENLTLLP